ncbi:MAG: ATP-dependent sacrificial sulfur transferase LarE [Thermoplasmata archaeon]|nr:ATP-dependent sacrificial sulfur transferase LarE [Thermoplasmata archaeon]MCI4356745.1 ATP-dependent sacrificial sulfur transferase LarE [Thermoplasmata archaeon]
MFDSVRARPRARREAELLEELRAGGPSVVALSGGVDSAVVAALAARALGPAAHAVTLVGPAVAREEIARAREVATAVGLAHELVPVDPLADDQYRANGSNRCYFCRRVESSAIRAWAQGRGVETLLDGVHWDDLGDDRPGIRAMDEAGFRHPLVWAGWGKSEVRAFAREAALPNWDAPSDACLASRIRHGEPVTLPLLHRVEAAERHVRSLGFRRVRVRVEGEDARIEVDLPEVERLRSEPNASRMRLALRELGFAEVRIDPAGYPMRPNA